MQCNAMQCNAMQCNAVLLYADADHLDSAMNAPNQS
jgi:hypothetical protein